MNNYHSLLISGAFMLFAAISAQAAPDATGTLVKPAPVAVVADQAWHIGALGGTTNANGGSNVEYGVDIGFQPYIPFSVGGELSRVDTGDLDRTKLVARGDYNFGGTLPVIRYSYVGAITGVVFDRSTDYDGNWIAAGPVLGFDIPVGRVSDKAVTLGAQAQYMFVEGSAPDAGALSGQVKFWF